MGRSSQNFENMKETRLIIFGFKIMESRYFNQKIQQQKKVAIQIFCALIENTFIVCNNVLRI